ncbi:DUF2510 domain-containing protein [Leifsonia sp. NPDC058248]|uniref:DUF2510 domain-containing protein n=1 Tax=Leifsonia sp. NPDC058248 TaxID=3346402 RepID=UPI0036DB7C14
MTDTRLPAAGWYADPANPLTARWWTGATWSEHIQAIPPEAAPVPVAPAPQPAAAPPFAPAPAAPQPAAAVPDNVYRPMARRYDPPLELAGRGQLKNVLAYRSVNFGVVAVILFVVSVICTDLAVHGPVFLLFASIAFVIVGTAIAVTGLILAIVSLFRVPTYRGLGPALTGLVLGLVFSFTILLVRFAMTFVLTFLG